MSDSDVRRTTKPRRNLGQRGAALLLATLRGELSPEHAALQLAPVKRASKPRPCIRGAHGVCLTHGQLQIECQQLAREDR